MIVWQFLKGKYSIVISVLFKLNIKLQRVLDLV